jgi:hypothetical protein
VITVIDLVHGVALFGCCFGIFIGQDGIQKVAVEYALTPLGRTLDGPFAALRKWTLKYLPQVEAAAAAYDAASRKG